MPNEYRASLITTGHIIYTQFLRRCTARGSSTGLCRVGSAKVKASKYFLVDCSPILNNPKLDGIND